MKPMLRIATLSAVVLLVSTAAIAADDLIGTWRVDTLKMMQMLGQTPPPGTDADALAEAYAMTIEMGRDGSWTFLQKNPNGDQKQTGQWKEVSREGDTVTIETSDDSGQTQSFVLTFETPDRVVATIPNGPKMFLDRVK